MLFSNIWTFITFHNYLILFVLDVSCHNFDRLTFILLESSSPRPFSEYFGALLWPSLELQLLALGLETRMRSAMMDDFLQLLNKCPLIRSMTQGDPRFHKKMPSYLNQNNLVVELFTNAETHMFHFSWTPHVNSYHLPG
ncbi:hypothetical protein GOODEAATRI_034108 [Goodea atripinnis]|uniref:Maturase K n=1 Tax=Goodea atripinnis TaxID=208336 RepID=A0ABV0NH17_9TELE